MGKMSRTKGAAGERELAACLRDYGFDCRRTAQYCGKTGDASDVVGLPGIHIECKRVERFLLYPSLEQAKRDAEAAKNGDVPVVFHRQNGKPWVCVLELNEFMKLYEGRKT